MSTDSKNTKWHSHDLDYANDTKIVMAEQHFIQSYGLPTLAEPRTFFWVIVDELHRRDGFIDVSDIEAVFVTGFGRVCTNDKEFYNAALERFKWIAFESKLFKVVPFEKLCSERVLRNLQAMSIKSLTNAKNAYLKTLKVWKDKLANARSDQSKEEYQQRIDEINEEVASLAARIAARKKKEASYDQADNTPQSNTSAAFAQHPQNERPANAHTTQPPDIKQPNVSQNGTITLGLKKAPFVVERTYFRRNYHIRFQDEHTETLLVRWVDAIYKELEQSGTQEEWDAFPSYIEEYVFVQRPATQEMVSIQHFRWRLDRMKQRN